MSKYSVATASDVSLLNVWRDGLWVKIDTWGGQGWVIDPDGSATRVEGWIGTLTMKFMWEESAETAEAVLREWIDADVPVKLQMNPNLENVIVTNQITNQKVASGQTYGL